MLCFRYRRLLAPYAEGALEERTRTRVERHIASCAACRAEVQCIRSVSDALRTSDVPAAEPSPDLWARVREQIEAEPKAAPARPSRLPQVAYGMAAVTFVAVLGWSAMRTQLLPSQLDRAEKPAAGRQAAAPKPAESSAKHTPVKGAAQKPVIALSTPSARPDVRQKAGDRERVVTTDGHVTRLSGRPTDPPTIMAKARDYQPGLGADTFTPPAPAPASPADPLARTRSASPSAAPPVQESLQLDQTPRSDAEAAKAGHSMPSPNDAKNVQIAGAAPSREGKERSLRASAAPSSATALSAADYLRIGNSQMAAGDKVNAANNFYNALRADRPSRWRTIANEAKQSGALDLVTQNAEKSFNTSQDPKSGLMLYELQSVQNNQSGMLNTAQQLVSIDSKSPTHWLKLGDAYEAAGKRAEALEAYAKAAAGPDARIAADARAKAAKLRKSQGQGQQ